MENKYIGTAGYKKIENYIKDLSRKPEFLMAVKNTRKEVGIPAGGFKYPDKSGKTQEIWDGKSFMNHVEKISEKYGIGNFREFIASYLLFSNTKLVEDYHRILVIKTVDMRSVFTFDREKDPKKIENVGKLLKLMFDSKTHPVGIFIHPYMSQRDIIDAVKKLYKSDIEPLQKKYRKEGIKFGVIRKKSERAEERNKFIYENRIGKSTAELVRLVSEKYGEVMDYTYINRIIKEEREKNK
jgi:hypothetical protein